MRGAKGSKNNKGRSERTKGKPGRADPSRNGSAGRSKTGKKQQAFMTKKSSYLGYNEVSKNRTSPILEGASGRDVKKQGRRKELDYENESIAGTHSDHEVQGFAQ